MLGLQSHAALVPRDGVKTIIFACVHNAGRSQMAAAYFNTLVDPKTARAVSAGTRPGERVHPEVVQVMQPGFALSGRLLRPAMVGVSKGGPKPQAEAGASVDRSA